MSQSNRWTRVPRVALTHRTRVRRTLIEVLTVTSILTSTMALPAFAVDDILILAPTVSSGTSSVEYRVITSTGTVPGLPAVTGLGMTAKIVSAADWPSEKYSDYKAIVLGDPLCRTNPSSVAAAEANAMGPTGWAAAVTGNVVIIGTDSSLHTGAGGVRGAQLWRSAIAFAAAGTGTGAVISLSCYYNGSPSGTPVPVLKGFEKSGSFSVQGGIPCLGAVDIVASSPALTLLTGGSGGTLSNWGCSVHEGFNSWDPSFIPLAIATDVPPSLRTYPVADPRGFPYILARGEDLTAVDGEGLLKICKVAGTGVPVGAPFSFLAASSTLTVPAGPAPGGTCVVGPRFPLGTKITVVETIPEGHLVSSIDVAPASQLLGTPNLAGGSVDVTIGTGVTEVTFTDTRTGFLEICKRGDVRGTFQFVVNPGGLGPFTVPAGACSPAIEVAAGTVTIHELPRPGTSMVGCSTRPASRQGPCNPSARISTVTVVPGDLSTQTIAFITNRRNVVDPSEDNHSHSLEDP